APPPAAVAPPPAAVAPPPVAVAPPPAAPVAVAPAPAAAPPPVAAPRPSFFSRFRGDGGNEEFISREKAGAYADVPTARQEVEVPISLDDIIDDLFEASQELYDYGDLREAAGFILDLAMKTIPSDSGAVFISDINNQDLYFAAARGPKSDEIMGFRVPMGVGIAGFSAQEGVSLAVSDVHKDPRFYARISQALGYETKSLLCSPAQKEGRVFGAIELINKSKGSAFSANEVNILNYLAHEFADYLIGTGQTGN
ncbi:GAF domain-containing protein, partial [Myxococcota bacterium]|nr:GAF domain-containing protein [Myxococcota bacterium]